MQFLQKKLIPEKNILKLVLLLTFEGKQNSIKIFAEVNCFEKM